MQEKWYDHNCILKWKDESFLWDEFANYEKILFAPVEVANVVLHQNQKGVKKKKSLLVSDGIRRRDLWDNSIQYACNKPFAVIKQGAFNFDTGEKDEDYHSF